MLRRRVPGSRSTAVALAVALAGVWDPATSRAAELAPDPEPTAAAGSGDSLGEAQRMYRRGTAKFETADYRAAIELWTEAYAMVPDTPEGSQIKALLIYNIATAREKAFEVSQDPSELRQAKILLNNFEGKIPALYGEGEEADAERAKVQARLAAVDEALTAYEATQDEADEGEPADDPTPPPDDPPPDPEPDAPPDGSARGLIIGGAVSLSLGAAGLAVMATGLGLGSRANDISDLADDDIDGRRDRFDQGRTGNALAIAGGITAGVLVITGSVLLALGLKRRQPAAVALVPSASPRGPALVLRGRF